jgi:hypothetical protein
MAPKKKKPMQASPSKPRIRPGRSVNVWISAELGEAVDAYLAGLRPPPSLTGVVSVALEEFLAKRGRWTLAEGGGE